MTAAALIGRPEDSEYAPGFAGYVARVPEADVLAVLDSQAIEIPRLFRSIPAERLDFRYGPGKWSPRQLAGHVIDAERTFAYRALAFARGEQAPLPGFDEEEYARQAPHAGQPIEDLAAEFEHTRRANVLMLRALDRDAWHRSGVANSKAISVRALAYVMAGHVRHHAAVLREKYLIGPTA
jgi:hypothetical protein